MALMLWSSHGPGLIQLPERREARWLWRWHLAKIGCMEWSDHSRSIKIQKFGASQFGSSLLVTCTISVYTHAISGLHWMLIFEQGGCWMTSYVGMTAPWRPKACVWFYLVGWDVPFVGTILWTLWYAAYFVCRMWDNVCLCLLCRLLGLVSELANGMDDIYNLVS